MTAMPDPLLVSLRGRAPELHPESWVAPNASLIGQVRLAARASVWYSAVLRAEAEPIDIGVGTNIQDGVTVHVDAEYPVRVGAGVSVGHNAVLHGCTVEDGALIGMGAIVLNGAVIGAGSLIAAGALIPRALWSRRDPWWPGYPAGCGGNSATPNWPPTATTPSSTSG